MTTTAPRSASTPVPRREPSTAITLRGTIRSEWIKLRSVRSSVIAVAAASVAMIVSGALTAAAQGTAAGGTVVAGEALDTYAGDPTALVLTGSEFASLTMAALGVLLASSEYATGTIRTTFAAVPSRWPVLVAKASVLTAVVLPLQFVVSLIAFVTGTGILTAMGEQSATLATPGALGAVVGTAVFLTGVALIGLAIGFILRMTAPALTVAVALIFILPTAGGLLLPAGLRDEALSLLPANAAGSFTTTVRNALLLTPTAGAVVFAAWVVVPLLVAAVLIRRRDV